MRIGCRPSHRVGPHRNIAGVIGDAGHSAAIVRNRRVVSVTLVAPHRPGEATTVTSAGQVIEGGWLSVTITNCEQVAVLP